MSNVPAASSASASPGRRRDPNIGPRVIQSAIDLYAREGWSGFTFEAAAREAGVGKPSLYRRWRSPAHLLIDAFETLHLPTARDCGSLRADLHDYGMQWIEWYKVPTRAEIGDRLAVDRMINEELEDLYLQIVYRPRAQSIRQIGRRAKARGEHGADEALVATELLIGAIGLRWQFTSAAQKPRLIRNFSAYIEEIVDIIMIGIEGRNPGSLVEGGMHDDDAEERHSDEEAG